MKLRWLREGGRARAPWLGSLVVAAAAAWGIAQYFTTSVAWRISASAAAIVIPIVLTELISEVFKQDDERTKACVEHLRGYSRRRGVPTVDALHDMTTLGVTPSRGSERDELPSYVRRDKDDELDALLDSRRFVLLIGDSKAGKSRMAAEAMRRKFRDRKLIIPDNVDSLPALLDAGLDFQSSVVWLDDLQRYLEKTGVARLLSHLASPDGPHDATVLATIREKAYALYMPDGEMDSQYWAVLNQANRLRIDRLFSPAERERAAVTFQDPHLIEALDRYGLAEYLSAGPDLVERFENGILTEPVGAMVVLAAADWSRTGLTRPVPQTVLLALVQDYLGRLPLEQPGPSDINTALTWAQKPVYGVSQLLSTTPDGFTVFEYVLDHISQTAIPNEVWDAALTAAEGDEFIQVGLAARAQNRLDIAVRAFEVAVQTNTPYVDPMLAAYNYACVLEKLNRTAEAEEYYRKAAVAGHVDAAFAAGRLLEAGGEPAEAERYYQMAAEGGSLEGAFALGVLLRERDPDEALSWFDKAAVAGHVDAAFAAGRLLEARGEPAEAERYYQMAAASQLDHNQLSVRQPGLPTTAKVTGRTLRLVENIVDRAHLLEGQMSSYSDAELRQRTASFTRRVQHGENLDDVVPEAFAVAREAARRVSGLQCLDVQLVGALALHLGYIAEMHRAEGRSVAAMLAAYLNALSGDPVHIVAADEATARRDVARLGNIYRFLGMDPSVVIRDMTMEARRVAYAAPITYSAAAEFAHDYLRDHLPWMLEEKVQRGLNFAIVDEADQILVDDAFQQYNISRNEGRPTRWYTDFAKLAAKLKRGVEYDVDDRARRVELTAAGITAVEDWFGIDNLYDPANTFLIPLMDTSLQAKELHRRDENYVVYNKRVLPRDPVTGEINETHRLSGGVHQAIEAKEGVPLTPIEISLACMHQWAYFNLYKKLSGLSGTASAAANEFRLLYKHDVCEIPTHETRKLIRHDDLVFHSDVGRWSEVADLVAEHHATGQPVLVDVSSNECADALSGILSARDISHQVLTTHDHQHEDEALAVAGRTGAVTIGTNLYRSLAHVPLGGRDGTPRDHDDVVALGGLMVIGSARHVSRRADERLCELAANRGEPGECIFMISKNDELGRLLRWWWGASLVGDLPVSSPLITRSFRSFQRTLNAVECENMRRNLGYDDVFETHRAYMYQMRDRALKGDNLDDLARAYLHEVVDSSLSSQVSNGALSAKNLNALDKSMAELLGVGYERVALEAGRPGSKRLTSRSRRRSLSAAVHQAAQRIWDDRIAEVGSEVWFEIERRVLISVIDRLWRSYIKDTDELRQASSLAAVSGHDPLIEFRTEMNKIFDDLIFDVRKQFVGTIMNLEIQVEENPVVEADDGPLTSPDEQEQIETATKAIEN